jgi:hypothetical protein
VPTWPSAVCPSHSLKTCPSDGQDFDAEFRYDRRPLSAIAGLDPGRITFSALVRLGALQLGVLLRESFQFLGVVADQLVMPLAAVFLVSAHRLRNGSVPISNSSGRAGDRAAL